MSTRLARVREIWDVMTQDATEGSEALLAIAAPDCVFNPAIDPDRELHGAEEVRAYMTAITEDGMNLEIRADDITEDADARRVMVEGSIRVHRPDGSFADSTVRWAYDFDEADRMVRATSS